MVSRPPQSARYDLNVSAQKGRMRYVNVAVALVMLWGGGFVGRAAVWLTGHLPLIGRWLLVMMS